MSFNTWTSHRPIVSKSAATDLTGSLFRAGGRHLSSRFAAMRSSVRPIKRRPNRRGLPSSPPATWEQLDSLAKFFHGRDWSGDGKPDLGIALALGAGTDGLGDATFLARSASLGQHRDHYSFLFDSDTMAPRIDTPPFVEALRGLVALKGYGPRAMEQFDADRAQAAFRTGDVALLIDRAERADAWSHGKPIASPHYLAQIACTSRSEKNGSRRRRATCPAIYPEGGAG